MVRRIALLLSLIFALAVSSSAGAQSTPTLDPADVEGLESGYARAYIADIEALMATPGAIEELSLDDLALSGLAAVFTFEDEEAASNAFGDFADQFAEGFLEGSGTEAEPTEIDDLGEQAIEYFGETEVDAETTAPTSMMIVQEGEYIYVSVILGGTDASESSRTLVEHLMDGEIGEDEVVFNEDGTSTGGVFELMPNEENPEVVQDMVPFMDMDFMAQSAAE